MSDLKSGRIDVPDSLEAINEYVLSKGWTDGLPIIPPTEERVAKLVEAAGRLPEEVIARIPPALGKATVEKIAINAVMAGCLPQHIPVVVAAIEAMCEPEFNLNGIQATTNPVAPATIVNGPIRHRLNINSRSNCLGPGWRANATIGRALSLLLLNVGGAKPGDVDKAVHGQPGKYTFCFAEDEEGNPWEPLHVERGFQAEESAVTVVSVTGTTNVNSTLIRKAKDMVGIIADVLTQLSSNDMKLGGGQPTVVLTSGHAALFQSDGYSKSDVKNHLFESSGVPLSEFPEEWVDRVWKRDGKAYPARCAEDIVLVVAGAAQPYHITCMTTFGTSRVQTKTIRESC